MNVKIIFLLNFSNLCEGYDRKFLEVENCTASGRTVIIHERFRDNKINVKVDILPSNKNSSKVGV